MLTYNTTYKQCLTVQKFYKAENIVQLVKYVNVYAYAHIIIWVIITYCSLVLFSFVLFLNSDLVFMEKIIQLMFIFLFTQ